MSWQPIETAPRDGTRVLAVHHEWNYYVGKEYGWMYSPVETSETFTDWENSSNSWNERTTMKSGTFAGFPVICWSNAQIRKGQTRQAITVIDFGDVRGVFSGLNITDFDGFKK